MDRQRAFTLIELLVVIAIIALLMAILMPALNYVTSRPARMPARAIFGSCAWSRRRIWLHFKNDSPAILLAYGNKAGIMIRLELLDEELRIGRAGGSA